MKLTLVIPNKNRMSQTNKATQWLFKTLLYQTYRDFKILVVDGGSDNYNELQEYIKNLSNEIPIDIIQYPTDPFWKTFLNNYGIRSARTEYIMTTDADIMFEKTILEEVMSKIKENTMIVSRTFYFKAHICDQIHNGQLDFENNIEACKVGKIKKRTTCGGLVCMHFNDWNKLGAYNQAYRVWGSEDLDLLYRTGMADIKIVWLGEDNRIIKVFHQPHVKNIELEMKWQNKNLNLLHSIKDYKANDENWGLIV